MNIKVNAERLTHGFADGSTEEEWNQMQEDEARPYSYEVEEPDCQCDHPAATTHEPCCPLRNEP